MKKILTLLSLAATLTATRAQVPVCHTPATDKFALFASNKAFNAEHPRPRLYTHVSQAGGKMVQFAAPDGQDASAYYLPAKQKSDRWILVFQEWWGLNDNIKRQAEDLHTSLGNVHVLALDMYDGKLATEAKDAGRYMQEFKQYRGDAIVKGALKFAGPGARIGTVGWCFGGGQSLQAALTAREQAVACVMYYGMPEENVDRLKTLNCDVLKIFASKDRWINADVIKKFEDNMKAAGKNLTVKTYEADHGFANPSNPMGNFNEAAYKDAYDNTVAFFRARLK
jgi:carboxymethylenebutenolidase